ncbi:hypothetical protein JCM8097_008344 [Rhodosporidiobolus ruineniae]
MTSLETTGITVTWKAVNAAKDLLEFEDQEGPESPKFDKGRWRVSLQMEDSYVGVYLEAHFTADERRPDGYYERAGTCVGHFELPLYLRCTVTTAALLPIPNRPGPYPTPSDDLLEAYDTFFDAADTGDACFVFDSHGSIRRIYAYKPFLCKRSQYFKSMFESGFAEGVSKPAELCSEPATAEEDARPAKRPRLASPFSAAFAWADDSDSADYITYRAMLYWIHTEIIDFLPPASNFTVALSAPAHTTATPTAVPVGPAPSKPASDAPASDDSPAAPPNPDATTYPSRRAYLLAHAPPRVGIVDAASPHAVYRLADKLDLPQLKRLAMKAVVKGYTVENILYELVSTFAYHYDEIRDAALDFAWKNWSAVSSTTAFTRVVAGASGIGGGTDLLARLMKGLAEPSSEGKLVGA